MSAIPTPTSAVNRLLGHLPVTNYADKDIDARIQWTATANTVSRSFTCFSDIYDNLVVVCSTCADKISPSCSLEQMRSVMDATDQFDLREFAAFRQLPKLPVAQIQGLPVRRSR